MFKTHTIRLLSIAIIALLSACNKDAYLTNNFISSADLYNATTIDSFEINVENVKHDSVAASGLQTLTLGKITSPFGMGILTANIYCQFNLPKNNFDFGTGGIIDSAVISFPIRGTYGDTTTTLDVSVFAIDPTSSNKIVSDAVYFSNKTFTTLPTVIAQQNNIKIKNADSILIYNTKAASQLRIPINISSAFITSLLAQQSNGSFADNNSFHNYLNGILIKTTSAATNGLLQLNSADVNYSGLTIYYHNNSADSLTAVFGANAGGVINNFKTDITGSTIETVMNNTTRNDDKIYISGCGGIRAKITIPALSSFKNIIINKAELTFSDINPTYSGMFYQPGNLLLSRKSTTTIGESSLEDLTEGSPISTISDAIYYGGIRTNGIYKFNISRYLQKLVNGIYSNDGFYISAYNAAERPAQVVLGGKDLANYKIKLKLIYTKIK